MIKMEMRFLPDMFVPCDSCRGQRYNATTLSGGEAQRVKLALELSKRDTGRTLYSPEENP